MLAPWKWASSNSHPLAAELLQPAAAAPLANSPPLLDEPGPKPVVLSVWNTFIGLVLRTSHTATTPSWDAMANLAPSAEKAVEKDAASALDGSQNGSPSAFGRVKVVIGVNVSLAPPDTW